MNLPIAIVVALLISLSPFLAWRGTPRGELGRKLLPSAVGALVLTVVAAVVAVRNPFYLLYVFLALLALGTNLHKAILMARPGYLEPGASAGAVLRGWLRGLVGTGGYLAHVGVGIILIGFLASSAYDQSTKVNLELDHPQQVGTLKLTFVGFLQKLSPRERDSLVVRVERPDGSTFDTYPKLFRNRHTGQIMANPYIRTSLLRDLYVSPIAYSPGESRVRSAGRGSAGMDGGKPPTLSLDVTWKPLIQLVWLGLDVILIGGLLAVAHRLRQARRLGPSGPAAGAEAASAGE